MKTRFSAALLLMVAFIAGFCGLRDRVEAAPPRPQQSNNYSSASQARATDTPSLPGADDSLYGPSFSSLAWGLFMEAMSPGPNDSLAFEGWTEECQLNPEMAGCPSESSRAAAAKTAGSGKVRLLHAGATGHIRKIPGTDCGPMRTTAIAGYHAPSNLAKNAIFCEEVYVSPPEADFVKQAGLTTLVGQQTYGNEHTRVINFPGTGLNQLRPDLDSLEVKLDWAPATSFHPTFACPDQTNQLYTQTINGTCYALVGVHVTSKVMPTWLWATFEPASKITNPNRCDDKLYGKCFDPWGTTSSEPYGKGKTVQQSEELRQAMAAANLHPAFRNYFLTGVQTKFVDSYGKPIQLGNSFVEFNQGVAPGKSSCITCHQYAHFDGKQTAKGAPENNFGKPPHGWPSIGYACNQHQNDNCFPADSTSTLQDFSWMLGKMPYGKAVTQASPDRSKTVSVARGSR